MAAAAPASRDRAASANGDAPRANGRRGGAGGRGLTRIRPEGGNGNGSGAGTPAGHPWTPGCAGITAAPACPAARGGRGEAAVAARLESQQGPKGLGKEGRHLQRGKKEALRKLILIKPSPSLYPKRSFRGNRQTLSVRNRSAHPTRGRVRDLHHPCEGEL